MNLADWLLSSNYLHAFNSIKLILLNVYHMLGTVLDTGDGETIKTNIDPTLGKRKGSFSNHLLCAQPHRPNPRDLNNNNNYTSLTLRGVTVREDLREAIQEDDEVGSFPCAVHL